MLSKTMMLAMTTIGRLAYPAAADTLKIGLAGTVTSIDPHFYNASPNNSIARKAAIGTGAFRFGSFRQGDEVVLERNPDWWGP